MTVDQKTQTPDVDRKALLLFGLHAITSPNMGDLSTATGIPARSVHTTMEFLKKMDVKIERLNGRRHGYFHVESDGAFNKEGVFEYVRKASPDLYKQVMEYADMKRAA